mgnify:CR=1 FL=1
MGTFDHAQPSVLLARPRPRETIFSVCSRTHWASGHIDARRTSTQLLGHGRGGVHHDFPRGMQHLRQVAGGQIGSLEVELCERTVLGVYWPFMSSTQRARVLRLCAASTPSTLNAVRAGVSWQIAPRHELRYCPKCLEIDQQTVGHGYWHTEHQWPGVWICPIDGEQLRYVTRSSKCAAWLTVEQAVGDSRLIELPRGALEVLRDVSLCCTWIASQSQASFEALGIMVRSRMRKAGVVRRELSVTADELKAVSSHFLPGMCEVMHFESFQGTKWMQDTLVDHRAGHPLRWAVLLSLHGSVAREDLECEYRDAIAQVPQRDLFDRGEHRRAVAPPEFYHALSEPTQIRQAARTLDVDANEIQSWIRRDRQLASHWRASRADARRHEAISAIEAFLRANPTCLRIDVLRSCLWAVRALERYDQAALARLLPAPITKHWRQLQLFG